MVTKLNNIFTTVEVARLLGVSETTIRYNIEKGNLHAYQIPSKQYLIEEKALNAYIQNRNQKKKPHTMD